MKKILIISLLLFTLCGCNTKVDNRESEIKKSNNVPLAATGKYLFNADKMETAEISGDDLLNRKKVEMSIENPWEKRENMELIIERLKNGFGISLKFFSGSIGSDFVSGLDETLEWGGAKAGFYYQLAVYDFNNDGNKEIIDS